MGCPIFEACRSRMVQDFHLFPCICVLSKAGPFIENYFESLFVGEGGHVSSHAPCGYMPGAELKRRFLHGE